MAKYGSPSTKLLLVDGYDLRGVTTDISAIEIAAMVEQSDVLGDDWREQTPTGIRTGSFGQSGFYDDSAGSIHDALKEKQGVERIVVVGIAGNAAGVAFTGFKGAFNAKYARVASRGALVKANAEYAVSGEVYEGVVLQPLAAKTADWNTEGAESVDNGASSANGGAAFLQVKSFSGFTGFVAKVRHSADDVTYADLVTFDNVTSGPTAQLKTVSGTVNRHLAVAGDVTGSGSITAMVGFARNP